jgi:hypothetical protein
VANTRGMSAWFADVFKTKEGLASRFGQLAVLRNAIRRSRTVSGIALKDGEAALLWFEQTLDAVDAAAIAVGADTSA